MSAFQHRLVVHLISARSEEAFATRDVLATATQVGWTPAQIRDKISYQTLSYNQILMYLSFPADQGGDFALSHIKDCLQHFRPDLCIMTGICAGQRGKIHLGDVIVATRAFNYERGKKTDGGHQVQPILFCSDALDSFLPWIQATMSTRPWASHTVQEHPKYQISNLDFLKRALYEYQHGVERSGWLWAQGFDRSKSIIENKGRITDYDANMRKLVELNEVQLENLQLKLSSAAEETIKTSLAIYGDYPEPSKLKRRSEVQYGVYASGSTVRTDTFDRKYVPWGSENKEAEEKTSACFDEAQKQYRNTKAVEMEGASFYQALQQTQIKAICVKGVSDYGDHKKDDEIHQYAKEAAASYAWELIQAYYEIEKERLENREEKRIDSRKIKQKAPHTIEHNTLTSVASHSKGQGLEERPLEGERRSNLTNVVNHFKRRRLEELKVGIQGLKDRNRGLVMCAITGVAGCGKSELAKAYANESPDSFNWRLDPDPDTKENPTKVSYQQAYSALLRNFGMQFKDSVEEQRQLLITVWSKINRYSQWVVIFDNVGSYADIEEYLPSGPSIEGLILCTTRHSLFLRDDRATNFSLDAGLEESEAVGLLKELSNREKETNADALNLAKGLNYFPLGIRIAGSYLQNVQDTSFNEYTQLVGMGAQEELIQIMGGAEFIRQVTKNKDGTTMERAIQISLNKVRQSNPCLLRVLGYCAVLANDNIPLNLLVKTCTTSQDSKLVILEKLKAISVSKDNYSLLSYDGVTQTFHLHRTTQFAIRRSIDSVGDIIQNAISAALELYQYDEYLDAKIEQCHQVSAHLIALSQWAESYETPISDRVVLLHRLAQVYRRFSKYNIGLEFLDKALTLIKKQPEYCSQETELVLLQEIASYEYELERYGDSINRLKNAQKLTKEPFRINRIQIDLAKNYNGLHESGKARATYNGVLEMRSQKSREWDLTRADAHVGIALCLQSESDLKYANAEPDQALQVALYEHQEASKVALAEHKRALEIYEKHLGTENLSVAITYTNIGKLGLLRDERDFVKFINLGIDPKQAEAYLRCGLAIKIRFYGQNARSSAISYEWLSQIIYVSKRFEEALENCQRAIWIYESILKPDSERLIDSYYLKGRILEAIGGADHTKLALEAYERAFQVVQKYPIRQRAKAAIQKRLDIFTEVILR